MPPVTPAKARPLGLTGLPGAGGSPVARRVPASPAAAASNRPGAAVAALPGAGGSPVARRVPASPAAAASNRPGAAVVAKRAAAPSAPQSTPEKRGAVTKTSKKAEPIKLPVRLRVLANAVRALVALNRRVARFRSPDKTEYKHGDLLNHKYLRTDSGSLRQRLPLALGPLGNFSDQASRAEISNMAPGVYQCSWRGGEDLEAIEKLGITHVLSTLEESENPFPEDLTYLNLVFEDGEDEDLSPHLEEAMDFIRAAISEGGGVLVHCAAGVSRSTALTLAYMMREHRMTLREALSAMRERRPIVWPNEGFVASLISLESSLIGINSLKMEEYTEWTHVNLEAIHHAKTVDRSPSPRVAPAPE